MGTGLASVGVQASAMAFGSSLAAPLIGMAATSASNYWAAHKSPDLALFNGKEWGCILIGRLRPSISTVSDATAYLCCYSLSVEMGWYMLCVYTAEATHRNAVYAPVLVNPAGTQAALASIRAVFTEGCEPDTVKAIGLTGPEIDEILRSSWQIVKLWEEELNAFYGVRQVERRRKLSSLHGEVLFEPILATFHGRSLMAAIITAMVAYLWDLDTRKNCALSSDVAYNLSSRPVGGMDAKLRAAADRGITMMVVAYRQNSDAPPPILMQACLDLWGILSTMIVNAPLADTG